MRDRWICYTHRACLEKLAGWDDRGEGEGLKAMDCLWFEIGSGHWLPGEWNGFRNVEVLRMSMVANIKLPPKRYKVGELVAFTGLTRQTIHNYTRWGLIDEVAWTEGGHRLYDEAVFERLARIVELREVHGVDEMREILTREYVNQVVKEG
ncbi:helix-turn-helix domain-containing protein [Poriferisphaera corsica]|nr:MerR family transcriptional regulator [Poriferisphaera corsica]